MDGNQVNSADRAHKAVLGPSPKVSVIIATYNRADYIVESLESVLNQTYKPFEVIVVDDGSTDNTEEVLQAYMGRIVYIQQENQGVSGATNRGLQKATGEYVAFQGSDDYWMPDKLEKQMIFLQRHPEYVMVTGNGVNYGTEECEGKPSIPFSEAKTLEQDGISLRSAFMKSSIRGAAMIVKRSVLEELGGFDTNQKSSVDVELAFRILKKHKIGFQNEMLIKIRKHDSNLGKDRESGQLENIKAIKKLLRNFPEAEDIIGGNNVRKRLAYRYYRLAKIHYRRRKYEKAIETIRQAHQYYPESSKYLFYRLLYEAEYLIDSFRKRSEFVKAQMDGFMLYLSKNSLHPSFLKWLRQELHNSQTDYLSTSRHAKNRRAAIKIDQQERVFFLKRYFSPRLSYTLKDIFRPSKALKALQAASLLSQFGFYTAPVAAAGEKRKQGLLADAFLVTEEVRALPIPEYVSTHFSRIGISKELLMKKRKSIRTLGAEVGRMHLVGILHGDLLPGNILLDDSGESPDFFFLDNDRTRRFLRNIPIKLVVRNLVQLGRFPMAGITLTDRLRFFKAYVERNPRFRRSERFLLARIVKKTRERVLKIERAGDPGAEALSFRMLLSGHEK